METCRDDGRVVEMCVLQLYNGGVARFSSMGDECTVCKVECTVKPWVQNGLYASTASSNIGQSAAKQDECTVCRVAFTVEWSVQNEPIDFTASSEFGQTIRLNA